MPRTNMRDLSFAMVNLLNLQVEVPGGLTYGSSPPFPDDAEGRAAYERKIAWLADRVRLLESRSSYQELWTREALGAVFATAGMAGEYDLVARDVPGRGRPQVAQAVRRGRHGQPQLLGGAEWTPHFPSDFRFDGLRETDGVEQEVTVTINEFSRPILRARIQAEGRSPTPPPDTVFAHTSSPRAGTPVVPAPPTMTPSAPISTGTSCRPKSTPPESSVPPRADLVSPGRTGGCGWKR